jgi:hypothetical protein
MEYRPSEIADELGVTTDTIYRGWVPAGCPHRRDETGHIWIVGTELAAWLRSFQRERLRLADGEAYCFRCQAAVGMQGPLTRRVCGPAVLVRGTCAQCGVDVARLVSANDPS